MSNQDNNQVRETQDQEEQLRNLCMKWGLLDNEGRSYIKGAADALLNAQNLKLEKSA